MATRWILRTGSKRSGFRYVAADGRRIHGARALQRIEALRVPPAWRDVHIAASRNAPIQAWGYDARGRRQYRYHARAVERGELRKYHRVLRLARDLPRIRRVLRADSRSGKFDRDTVAAVALRLIGETFCRVGGERGLRENGTFGITTLRASHVYRDERGLYFEYRGKGRRAQRQAVVHAELAGLVRRQLRSPGTRLFRFRKGGAWRDLTAREVNAYLRMRIGGGFSAKDFRTWGGCLRAATVLAEIGPPRSPTEAKRNVAMAMRLVGAELGNTATICRKSYVHPILVARYLEDGETIRIPGGRSRARGAHSAEERALIRFLDRHFPERRKKSRRIGRETGPSLPGA